MLPILQGYSGFQSYQTLPYPTLKVGETDTLHKGVWARMDRKQDHRDPLQNYEENTTIYKEDYLQTQPIDYAHPTKCFKPVVLKSQPLKSSASTSQLKKLNCGHNECEYGTAPKCRENPAAPLGPNDFLQTGDEHWNSLNRNDFRPPNSACSSNINDNTNANKGINRTVSQSGLKGLSKSKPGTSINDREKEDDFRWLMRQTSMATRTGTTQYKFNYGMRLGYKPNPDLMNAQSIKQPQLNDELKNGTTKTTKHIPGYQGFIPCAQTMGEAFKQGKGQKTRTTFIKNNLYQNYHVFIPGYTGHKPKSIVNAPQSLRTKCFEVETK